MHDAAMRAAVSDHARLAEEVEAVNASVEELSKIKGISDAVARTIYDHFHTVND